MPSQHGDGQPDPLGLPSESQEVGSEKPSDSGSLTVWSKADFVHWAQVLARRLASWHLDDRGPVWTPKGIEFLQAVERPFRHRVLQGGHDSRRKFAPPIRLIPNVPNANSSNGDTGYAVTLFPEGHAKDETVWLFRDYYEHLVQLGDTDAEDLLRHKIEQLLNCRMYRRARSEVLGDYIAGHPVDHSLLEELIEAAKYCIDNSSPGRKCGTCGKPLRKRDHDRFECNDCRSPEGRLEDLYIAIHASGDSPDRIPEWPTIRALLREAFGIDRTNKQLWEFMTDRLRVVGWDEERWLRTKYDQFIELLKAGLMKDRSSSGHDDSGISKLGTKPLADLALDHAKIRAESADLEWQNNANLERLEAAWTDIYVPFPSIGMPVDYAKWTGNLLAFARVAKEVGYAELFLKALPGRDNERKALSLIQAAIRGGEHAIRSRLLEFEDPLADREWKIVFNHSSLFWSIVRPTARNSDHSSAKESVDRSVPTPLEPYKWKEFLAEDEWIYENIHAYSLEDLIVAHDQQCQSRNHFEKVLARRSYWNRADRYAKYHDLPKRRFKGACKCPECQTVTDTPLTGD